MAGSRTLRHGGVAFAILVALYLLVASTVGDRPAGVAMAGLLFLAFPIAAAVLALRTSGAGRIGAVRVFWRLVAAGMAVMTAGEAWWIGYQVLVDPAGPEGVSVADFLYLPAYLLLFLAVGVLLFNRFGALSPLGRMKTTIDGLVLTTLAAILVTMVAPNLGSLQEWTFDVFALYTVLDLVILIGLFLATLIPGSTGGRWWEAFIGAGMGLFAAADLGFKHLSRMAGHGSDSLPGALLDVVWMAGYASIAAGAVRFRSIQRDAVAPVQRQWSRRMEVFPLLLAVVSIPLFMWAARFRAGEGSYWIWVVAATWLGMLVVSRIAVIVADNRELVARSVIDPLTGVHNHRFFHERLGIELDRARRNEEPLSLAILDLDELRALNNRRGHLAGDRRIRLVAAAVSGTVRTTDIVSRIGGDEFAVILPATGVMDAYAVVDRIMDEIVARQVGQDVRTPVSVGLASFPEHAEDKDQLISHAADALTAAKDAGRSRAVIYEPGSGGKSTEERIRAVEAESLLRTVRALAAAVDARDAYTHSHSRSVAKLAVALGRRLGLPAEHVDRLKIAALLHDVGKIGTPDHVLRKPSELNDEEYRIVMGHPELGERILASAVTPEILPWVAAHHERWDGSGYPRGISGEEIPMEARIIAICDTFDAMTSDRPYRSALPVSRAVEEIEAFAGRQFDPGIAATFVAMMRDIEQA